MERGYEFRIYPTAAQREQIERTFGCCRWVFNRCLETRKTAYEETGTSPSTYGTVKMIPAWKAENPWLSSADSIALQQAARDCGRAFDNFFRTPGKVGFPKFKSKRGRQSYRTQNIGGKAIQVLDGKHVKLPKLGTVKARVSRPVEGRIVNATVKRTPTGKYLVVLCCTGCPAPEMAPGPNEITGVDSRRQGPGGVLGRRPLLQPAKPRQGREEARPRAEKAVEEAGGVQEPREAARQVGALP